jgi:hypothetical protein
MRTTIHQPRSLIFKLLIPLFLLLAIQSCDCNDDDDRTPGPTSSAVAPERDGGEYLFGQQLDTLKLTSADYNALKAVYPSAAGARSKLVFQFHFDKTISATSPSLIAYASKPGNQFRSGAVTTPVSRVLAHGGTHLTLPNVFVLGDQQIRFDDIDGIVGGATSYTLYFIPVIQPGAINVSYKICINTGSGVVCLAPPPETQPSPPANTY